MGIAKFSSSASRLDRRSGIVAEGAAVTLLVVAALLLQPTPKGAGAQGTAPEPLRTAGDDAALFAPIAAVIRHPRCMNCHTSTDFPRQNDDRRRHAQNVVRGPDDHGIPGMECSACHGDVNNEVGGVPGAPHWSLAPLSMAWERMSDRDICLQLQDLERNGGRSLADIMTHMTEDALVLWAWEPGLHPGGAPRSTPPVGLEDWEVAMAAWIDADAPCSAEDGS